jgi:exodeoxyribonuclease VII small subunit
MVISDYGPTDKLEGDRSGALHPEQVATRSDGDYAFFETGTAHKIDDRIKRAPICVRLTPSLAGVDQLSFESAIEEFETTVRRLEEGNVPIKESIALYERGEALKRRCEELLHQAEQRVTTVTKDAPDTPSESQMPASTESTVVRGASPFTSYAAESPL